MNQKGFATILGLCLILAIALVVKGIQESEGNHASEMTDFQTEYDLQSAAESGIYMAAAIVKENPLPPNTVYDQSIVYREEIQEQGKVINGKEIETSSGSIKVNVWAERVIIKPYEVNYSRKRNNKYYRTYPFIDENKQFLGWKGYVFFSVAELVSTRTGGTLNRRAFAYVVESAIKERIGYIKEEIPVTEKEKNIIHFMNEAKGDFYYEKVNNPDRK